MNKKIRSGMALLVSQKERELGVRVKCFESRNLAEACELKNEWFARRNHLTILKEKTRVTNSRGAVVGKWKSSKVYVSFIPTKNLEVLKQYRRERNESNVQKKTNQDCSPS